jgi:hypothetical protein
MGNGPLAEGRRSSGGLLGGTSGFGRARKQQMRRERLICAAGFPSAAVPGYLLVGRPMFHPCLVRTKFARLGKVDGPQVIILSHDTLLEKLFKKNANSPDWQNVRLEGNARTAVLPQSNAGNRVRDATVRFLNAGQLEHGALRLPSRLISLGEWVTGDRGGPALGVFISAHQSPFKSTTWSRHGCWLLTTEGAQSRSLETRKA